MANNKIIRNSHAKKYIEAVFASRLREEGFAPSSDTLLCWHRIVNNEIVNSIGFFSRWANLPLMLEIGYGIYPLFVKPFHYSDVYLPNRPWDERFFEVKITEPSVNTFAPYSSDTMVLSPAEQGRGISTFDSIILPQMDSVRTIEECYRINRKLSQPRPFGMTLTMIDEAILLNDILAHDNCKRAVEKMLVYYKKQSELYPNQKEYKEALTQIQIQKAALWDKKCEEFLASIQHRKQQNLALMTKRYGITLQYDDSDK